MKETINCNYMCIHCTTFVLFWALKTHLYIVYATNTKFARLAALIDPVKFWKLLVANLQFSNQASQCSLYMCTLLQSPTTMLAVSLVMTT